MQIKTFVSNPIGENTYVISDGNEAAIIDCGAYSERQWQPIKQYIEENGLNIRYALQTHTHFDHIYGLHFVERDFGIKPMFHALDHELYTLANDSTMAMMGEPFPYPLPSPCDYLKDGQHIMLGSLSIEVIHTPGHTPGGVCLYIEQESIAFSGDTLFAGSIGRYDLPGGDFETEVSSIRERLFTLPENTVVYPGHGPCTTIAREKMDNAYL